MTVDTLLYLVQCHGGAVVEQEVVSVNPILRTAVLNEQFIQLSGLPVCQIELLGEYLRSAFTVFTQKRPETCGSQNVVSVA